MIPSLFIQKLAVAVQDTVTSSYADKWNGAESVHTSGPFIAMMASHNLIFVVLAVSLIIWFVLLFFIIRTDQKVSKLEDIINQNSIESDS
jgi:uncharacterized membrane protein